MYPISKPHQVYEDNGDYIRFKAETQISSLGCTRLHLQNQNCISDDVHYFVFRIMHEFFSQEKQHDVVSKPMPWIGIYIAVASLVCILLMLADLIHGFRNRKLWFPCKYFTLNAASLTVIAIAMKLPMDLSNPSSFSLRRDAKFESMAFMCTMMANFMPSLATMDNMQLVTNIVALGVLVITLIVNICIQIYTGSFMYSLTYNYYYYYNLKSKEEVPRVLRVYEIVEIVYAAILLWLLIIQTCSAFTILKSKQILESKYQARHEIALQESGRLTVEKLKKHVTTHWIMVETGSPQFIMACSVTTSVSGLICALNTTFVLFILIWVEEIEDLKFEHDPDYKWSTQVILITQLFGIGLGTIAPLCRCFAALSFNLSISWIRNNFKVFKVESYWTQKLHDWKQSGIPVSIHNRKSKIVIHNFKILILGLCIGFQYTVVVACKMLALIPIFFVVCVSVCINCWKHIKAKFSTQVIVLVGNSEQLENYQDHRRYVLQLHDDMEVSDKLLDNITKSLKRLIEKAEKQQPNQLIKLLRKSEDFKGVQRYGSHLLQILPAEDYRDSWSLLLVSLTTIAISLINFQKDEVDTLLNSVSEGLEYVTHVEECFSATDEYVSSQKAAKSVWVEVEFSQKWLENNLKNAISQLDTTRQILEWFRDKANNIVTEVVGMDIDVSNEKFISRSICAFSMYYVAESLLHSHQNDINEVTRQELFEEITILIADILASCLTNLPQVILKKCHTNVIEEREASVYAAAQLLGNTMNIINSFQDREIPSLNQDELAFFDKWCAYYFHQYNP